MPVVWVVARKRRLDDVVQHCRATNLMRSSKPSSTLGRVNKRRGAEGREELSKSPAVAAARGAVTIVRSAARRRRKAPQRDGANYPVGSGRPRPAARRTRGQTREQWPIPTQPWAPTDSPSQSEAGRGRDNGNAQNVIVDDNHKRQVRARRKIMRKWPPDSRRPPHDRQVDHDCHGPRTGRGGAGVGGAGGGFRWATASVSR